MGVAVGVCEGVCEGAAVVGVAVGETLGTAVGVTVGLAVGWRVGKSEGLAVPARHTSLWNAISSSRQRQRARTILMRDITSWSLFMVCF